MSKDHQKSGSQTLSGQTGSTMTIQAVIASGDRGRNTLPLADDDIRLRAYRKWERAGKPSGDGIRFWLEAEQELKKYS